MDLTRFRTLPLLGILRGIATDDVSPLVDAAVEGGLNSLEITMNTPGAAALIERATRAAGGALMIGAGTVLRVEELERALAAGATFAVSPTLRPAVVARCRELAVPVFPGALTPQEIDSAWQAGATMVKVFPAGRFGPAYFRDVRGPFAEVELLACGGVTAANLGDYFGCGANAAAFGASVFRPDWLSERNFGRIRAAVAELVDAWRAWHDAAPGGSPD